MVMLLWKLQSVLTHLVPPGFTNMSLNIQFTVVKSNIYITIQGNVQQWIVVCMCILQPA